MTVQYPNERREAMPNRNDPVNSARVKHVGMLPTDAKSVMRAIKLPDGNGIILLPSNGLTPISRGIRAMERGTESELLASVERQFSSMFKPIPR